MIVLKLLSIAMESVTISLKCVHRYFVRGGVEET